MMATHEFVVPRSIPIVFPIIPMSFLFEFERSTASHNQ